MSAIYQNGSYAITYTDTGTNITAHVAVTRPTLRTVSNAGGSTPAGMWARFWVNQDGIMGHVPLNWGYDETYAPSGTYKPPGFTIASLFPSTHTFDITGLPYSSTLKFGVDGIQYWITNETDSGTYSGSDYIAYQTYNFSDIYYWREATAFTTPAPATTGGTTTPTQTLQPGDDIYPSINRVVFAQEDGPRTFFVSTIKDNTKPPAFVDERDRKVYPLTTPATPTITSAVVTQLSTNIIDSLTNASSTSSLATRTTLPAFTVHGHGTSLNSDGFANDGNVGGYWARVNTDSSSSTADGFWRDVVSTDAGAVADGADYYIDLSEARYLLVDVFPYEGNGDGCVSFVMSSTKTGATMPSETVIPINIGNTGTVNQCKIELGDVATAYKNKVKSWGFRFSSKQCTVSFHNLRMQKGLSGNMTIKAVDYRVLGSIVEEDGTTGYWIPSIESAGTEVKAGDSGAQVTFNLSGQTDATVTKAKIYVYVEGVTNQYHYVCDVTRTHAGSADSVTIPPSGTTLDDIVGNPTLTEGRCAIPQGATCVGFHHRRLVLYKKGTLYFSGDGDYTYFSTMTPTEALDNGYILTDSDPFTIPIGKYGPVYGIAPLGLATGAQYILGTLVMTGGGWDILVQGDTVNDISIADKRPGGLCTYYGWTRNKDRQIVKIDTEGDVRLYGQDLDAPALTADIWNQTRILGNKSEWWLGYEAQLQHYVLGCETGATAATATLTINSGVVTGVLLTYGGFGYTSTPTVVVTSLDGGFGCVLSATVTNGVVSDLTIVNGGNGYTTAPVVSFSGGLGTRKVYTYDLIAPGWDERDNIDPCYCQASTGVLDGSYLAVGQSAGDVKRVYDPSPFATKPTATYRTKDYGVGNMLCVPGEVKCHFTGTLTANVISKTAGVETVGPTVTLTSGQRRFLTTQKPGETVGLQLNLGADCTLKSGRFTVVPRRK